MKNPILINSANVQQLGFKATFNLFTKKVSVDLSGVTTFIGSGAANITSLIVKATDPSGYQLDPLTVNPNTLAPVLFSLLGSFSFGFWTIEVVLVEGNGAVYSTKVSKNICEPEGWDGSKVKGDFDIKVDCRAATATISETTAMAYLGKSPVQVQKSGKIFYPDNILNEQEFTFTPFMIGGEESLYSGSYKVQNTTIAFFDLQDFIQVAVPYKTTKEVQVACGTSLSQIVCCLEDLQNAALKSNTRGASSLSKLNEVTPYLLLAIIKDQTGKDASEEVSKMKDILDCDCGCGNGSVIEPMLISNTGGGQSLSVTGSAASSVSVQQSGNTIQYVVKSKFVSVVKGNENDLSYSISKTEDANNIVYSIDFDYDVLAGNILNAIRNDTSLTQIFNEMVGGIAGDVSLSGLDGKCVIDLDSCDYTYSDTATNKIVKSIKIEGVVSSAPPALSFTNAAGIQSWLNSLSKGTFSVNYDSGSKKTTITSLSNANFIQELTVTASGEDVTNSFQAVCTKLVEVLQAIIDYLCAITTGQVVLDADINLAIKTTTGGQPTVQKFDAGSDLQTFLAALASQLSFMVNNPTQGPKGDDGADGADGQDGRSVKVFVQTTQPNAQQGPFQNGDIWIVESPVTNPS